MGSPVNVIQTRELKNIFINGNFDYWQRGTTISGASIFGADRWKGNSAVASVERVDKTFAPLMPADSRYGCRLTSVVGGGAILQRVEASRLVGLAGKYITISFKAALVSGTTQMKSQINTPTVIDNYTSRNFGTQVDLGVPNSYTTGFLTFKRTYLVTPIMESNGFEITVAGDATIWSVIICQLMLVVSSDSSDLVPSQYVYAGQDLIHELRLCQRYFEKSYDVDTPVDTLTPNGMYQYITQGSNSEQRCWNFAVPKRAVPAMAIKDPVSGSPGQVDRARNVSTGAQVFLSPENTGTSAFGTQTANTAGHIIRFHWIADAEL